MKKALFLQALIVSFYAASSLAADTSCLAGWESDHSANYENCVIQQKAQIQAERQVQAKVEYATCIDNWKRDHSVADKECASSKIAGLIYQANRLGY